ncbi:unnamed protein product [Ectocarpus sp. 4 AP-2014]
MHIQQFEIITLGIQQGTQYPTHCSSRIEQLACAWCQATPHARGLLPRVDGEGRGTGCISNFDSSSNPFLTHVPLRGDTGGAESQVKKATRHASAPPTCIPSVHSLDSLAGISQFGGLAPTGISKGRSATHRIRPFALGRVWMVYGFLHLGVQTSPHSCPEENMIYKSKSIHPKLEV